MPPTGANFKRTNVHPWGVHQSCIQPNVHPRGVHGILITFEGTEGSGKSTHARLVFNYLKKKGYDCIFTREPGGTPAGDRIRQMLLRQKNIDVNDICELFLFEANRAQIVDDVILPALSKGKIVICDRFFDATVAYQGFGAGLDTRFIERLNSFAAKGIKPDVTILLDVETKKGLKRRLKKKKPDRVEAKSINFHKRVRNGYLKLAKKYPRRIKLFKSDKSIDKVQKDIREYIIRCLSRI